MCVLFEQDTNFCKKIIMVLGRSNFYTENWFTINRDIINQ